MKCSSTHELQWKINFLLWSVIKIKLERVLQDVINSFCPINLQIINAIKLLAFLSPSDPGPWGSFTRFNMGSPLCTDLIVLSWLLSREASISSPGVKSVIVLYTRFGSFRMNHSLKSWLEERGAAEQKGRRVWVELGVGILLTPSFIYYSQLRSGELPS